MASSRPALRRLAGRALRCRADRLHLLEPRPPCRQSGRDARLSALGNRTARRDRPRRPRRLPAASELMQRTAGVSPAADVRAAGTAAVLPDAAHRKRLIVIIPMT